MVTKIDGPRIAAKSGRTKQLVVFLHGYGADGRDLIAIGQDWQRFMPDAAFVAPHAPEPCAQAPTGRQWFPLTMRDPQERWTGVTKARPVLDAFLDAELARYRLEAWQLVLVGFSQGTMMALHVGLRRREAPACILGFSGLLIGPEHLDEAIARDRRGAPPPILLIHGSEDEVVPTEALFVAAEELAKAEIPCQWHLSIGIGHGIDEAGLVQGGAFIGKTFGLKGPAAGPARS